MARCSFYMHPQKWITFPILLNYQNIFIENLNNSQGPTAIHTGFPMLFLRTDLGLCTMKLNGTDLKCMIWCFRCAHVHDTASHQTQPWPSPPRDPSCPLDLQQTTGYPLCHHMLLGLYRTGMRKCAFILAWFLFPRIILPFFHTITCANIPFILFLENGLLSIYTIVYYFRLLTNVCIISSLELPAKEPLQISPRKSVYEHALLLRAGDIQKWNIMNRRECKHLLFKILSVFSFFKHCQNISQGTYHFTFQSAMYESYIWLHVPLAHLLGS